jgi:hypothetical protein
VAKNAYEPWVRQQALVGAASAELDCAELEQALPDNYFLLHTPTPQPAASNAQLLLRLTKHPLRPS